MGDASSQETHVAENESLAGIGALRGEAVKVLEANRGKLSSLLHDISKWKEANPLKEGESAYYRCGEGGKTVVLKVSSPEVSSYGPIADRFHGVEQLTVERTGGDHERVAFYWSGRPDVSWKSPDDSFSGLVCVGLEPFDPLQPEKGTDIYGFRGASFTKTDLFDRDFPLLGSSYWRGSYSESENRSFVHSGGDAVQKGEKIVDVLKAGSIRIEPQKLGS